MRGWKLLLLPAALGGLLIGAAGATTPQVRLEPELAGSRAAKDVDCNGCVNSTDIKNGTITEADLAFTPLTSSSLTWGNLSGIPSDIADGDQVGLTSVGWTDLSGIPSDIADGDQVGLTSVDWSDLTGIPSGFSDGTDNIDGGTAADLNCTSCVAVGELAFDPLTQAEYSWTTLPNIPSNVSGRIAADVQCSTRCIAAGEILSGTITANELGDGAVLTRKMTANSSVGTGSTSGTFGSGFTDLVATNVDLADTGTHAVLLTGGVDLECATSCPVNVLVGLYEGNALVSANHLVTLSSGTWVPVSVSQLITTSGVGSHDFHLRVQIPGGNTWTAQATSNTLSAVDLGRT
jgi:hypothetical protein